MSMIFVIQPYTPMKTPLRWNRLEQCKGGKGGEPKFTSKSFMVFWNTTT